MPGNLRADARCPLCGRPLVAILNLITQKAVTREYLHGPRTRKCKKRFTNFEAADQERKDLLEPFR